MQVRIATLSKRLSADLLVIPYYGTEPAAPKTEKFGSEALIDFKGEKEQTALTYGARKDKRILLLGLGPEKKCTDEIVRRSFAMACKEAVRLKCKTVNLVMPEGASVRAVVEGFALTNYAFESNKSKPSAHRVSTMTLLGDVKTVEAKQALKLCDAVCFTRDLVNGNADDVTPEYLASVAKDLAKHPDITTEVFNKKHLEKEKMGLILAVGRGSTVDPHMLIVKYKGNPKSKDHTVIIGKGVTFDTGGLNLKPTGFMEDMRTDMGGAAAALGAVKAASAMGLEVNVTAVVPTTENAISGGSYKPGDVYKSYNGTMVEISNTDAEGRLIMADALAYAVKNLKPTQLVDMATLTGAMVIALGEERIGLFCNKDSLAQKFDEAGSQTGEKVWRMPLDPEYRDLLDSDVADIKNCGNRAAGSVTAAKFLEEFVGKVPWAHLDIAGTAFPDGKRRPYHPSQATGVGVRLIVQLLENA